MARPVAPTTAGSADPHFNGLVDEFRIYRGALGVAGVAALIAS